MTARKLSKREQRDHLRAEIRKHYVRYLDKYPQAARQAALGLAGLLCSRLALEDLQEWSLALTISTECPDLATALSEPVGKPDDPP